MQIRNEILNLSENRNIARKSRGGDNLLPEGGAECLGGAGKDLLYRGCRAFRSREKTGILPQLYIPNLYYPCGRDDDYGRMLYHSDDRQVCQ